MEFDLIHRRHNLGLLHQVLKMPLAEVRDADCASASFGERLLDRLVGRNGRVKVRGNRLVKQEKIHVVEAQSPQAALEANERLVVAVVAEPQLRRDEQFTAVESGAADALADLALVVV